MLKTLSSFLACRSRRTVKAVDRGVFRAMAWGELHAWLARHRAELAGETAVYPDLHAVAASRAGMARAEINRRLNRCGVA